MASTFKNKVVTNLGTTATQLLQTTDLTRNTVIGLSFTNTSASNVSVNVLVEDDASSQGHYVKGVIIPPQNSLRVVTQGEKLILGPNNQLLAYASASGSIDAIVSYVEIY